MIETGIYFDNIHSYYDLNLILSEVEIPPAVPKEQYIDLAGGDGSLDLTEAHGEVKFNDRSCKFTFTMNPANDLSDSAFEEKKTEVSNALNGKLFEKITLDKDSDFYYQGRCKVDQYLSDKRIRQIVVTAKVKPYKMKQNETIATFALTKEEQTVNLKNGRKSVVPEITCTNDNTVVVFGSVEKIFGAGTHKDLDILFKEGSNVLKLSGSGNITFKYQEGEL
jgi:hypothetical protein